MKNFIKLVLLFLLPIVSMASNYAPPQQLQTFFTSPGVRFQLDQQRNSGKYDQNSEKKSAGILRKPLEVKMQGIVLRDKHKPVIFVNDSNTLKSTTVNSQITVKTHKVNTATVTVPVKVNSQSLKLKPGQQWNEKDRKTKDNYQIKPAKDEPEGVASQVISKIID